MLKPKYPLDQEFGDFRQRTGVMEAELVEIDQILEDEESLELVEADLSKRYP
jgi:hypothetical protein